MRFLIPVIAIFALITSSACTRSEQVKGKIFRTVSRDNIKTSDPTNAYDEVSLDVINQIYESPYQYNYYSTKTEVIPSLADGLPVVSKDKLTYTIKLKKDVRFQDDPCFKETQGKGREVKASDYLYGWKRHANPKNESQAFWIWDSKIAGINDFQKKFSAPGANADAVMKEEVEGMKALDDHTIQLKLTKPYPQLVYIMTMAFTAPVPHEAITTYGKDFVLHPVGTGPFKAKIWEPTSHILLVKNENFRDERFPAADKLPEEFQQFAASAGKKLPLVDAIDFAVVKEEQPRWLGFLDGKYDQIKIPKDNFDSAIENATDVKPEFKKKGISVSIEPSLIFWYVSVNMKDKVLGSNKYLRQAIASSVDRETWLKLFKNGRGSVQNEVNPRGIVDRCDNTEYKWSYNIERGKQLLAKAGYPDGKGLPVFRYDTRSTDPSERQLADFIAKNLEKVGIKVEITANTFPAYLDKMNKGNLQISKGGWNSDYPDAENNLQLLYGPNKAPGPNEANMDHPELNKLYDQMSVMAPSAERKKLICKMEALIQEEAPWAYGIYENEYRLVQKWLKNYHTAELVQNKYKYIDVDDQERGTLARR